MTDETHSRRRRRRLAALRVAILAVAALLIAVWLRDIPWGELGRRVADAHRWPVALAALALLGRFCVLHLRLYLPLTRIGPQPSHALRFFMLTSSILANHLTPSVRLVGGLLRARYLARYQELTFPTVYGAVLFDQLLHQAALGTLTWLALVATAWQFGRPVLAAWVAAGGLVAITGGAAWLRWGGERRRSWRGRLSAFVEGRRRLGSLVERGGDTARVLRKLLADRGLCAASFLLGVAFFAANVVSQSLLFQAIDARPGLLVVATTVSLGAIAGVVTGTPGGAGTTEAAMISCYVALGVEQVDAVTATLLFRGLHYALVVVLGLPPFAYFELRRRPE